MINASRYIGKRVSKEVMGVAEDPNSAIHAIRCYAKSEQAAVPDCHRPDIAERVYTALETIEKEHVIGFTSDTPDLCAREYRRGILETIE